MLNTLHSSYLDQLFSYNQNTGELRWKEDRGSAHAGDLAGTLRSDGYLRVSVDGKLYYVHRIAWAMVHDEWPELLDHIDGHRSNNRIKNLRVASKSQNAANCLIRSDNSSGYRGVSWCKNSNRWRANIQKDNKQSSLGYFLSKEDAALAYLKAHNQVFGEFSNVTT